MSKYNALKVSDGCVLLICAVSFSYRQMKKLFLNRLNTLIYVLECVLSDIVLRTSFALLVLLYMEQRKCVFPLAVAKLK